MLHVNFICLIMLGKLWRKRYQQTEQSRRYNRAHPETRRRCNAASRSRNLKKAKAGALAWKKANQDRVKAINRRSAASARLRLAESYVKSVIINTDKELRGTVLPYAFIESRKEVIHAKRILRKYKRDQELGGQPQVLEDPARVCAG